LNKSKKISRLDSYSPEIQVLGRVDDLGPLYDQARVFIAPTRFAAGIPLKIIEAAAKGVPVVTTSVLAQQLGWQAGRELMVADTAVDFAERCLELLTDADLWEKIRKNALERIRTDYSKAGFQAKLSRVIYG
jgi:glycosyltransferase involved in cell wall biosynthesis